MTIARDYIAQIPCVPLTEHSNKWFTIIAICTWTTVWTIHHARALIYFAHELIVALVEAGLFGFTRVNAFFQLLTVLMNTLFVARIRYFWISTVTKRMIAIDAAVLTVSETRARIHTF